MNRLTAIGLASLVAYGLLLASKYTGVVSAAHSDAASAPVQEAASAPLTGVQALTPDPAPRALQAFPSPAPRVMPVRASIGQEFRTTRDLKAFADGLSSRGDQLTADERYFLAKALEECQFVTSITEDLGAYSAKQRRQFLSSLPIGDPLNEKRISAYESVDNTQRCLGFKDAKFSARDIDALYKAAANQGDPRAQARIITAELSKNLGKGGDAGQAQSPASPTGHNDDLTLLTQLLDSKDPEALLYVGQFLAQNAITQNLRVGPNGEVPEPSAFLGGFSLVACDLGQDCSGVNRELMQACAYGGFCNAQTYEELYQNFLASPWAYSQAMRYRMLIRTAIDQRNYTLIGLTPKLMKREKATL